MQRVQRRYIAIDHQLKTERPGPKPADWWQKQKPIDGSIEHCIDVGGIFQPYGRMLEEARGVERRLCCMV